MNDQGRGCVLAGIDGSWRSAAVLDVAAREASTRGVPMVVVSVVRETPDPRLSLTAQLRDERHAAELTDWRLREAVSRVRARHPALELSTRRLTDEDLGLPGEHAEVFPEADLLVVGARGGHLEPVFGLGTVSRHLLKATHCPVLVVPEQTLEPGARPGVRAPAVVAGLDDGALAGAVLRAAVGEATLRGTSVVAVHTYRRASGEDPKAARTRALAGLRRLVAEVVDESAGAPVTPVVTDGQPAAALLAQARGASLLVLGTRGPTALAGLAFESVSRTVLDAAACPVLLLVPRAGGIVRARARTTAQPSST